jgi:hypothetical protein
MLGRHRLRELSLEGGEGKMGEQVQFLEALGQSQGSDLLRGRRVNRSVPDDIEVEW